MKIRGLTIMALACLIYCSGLSQTKQRLMVLTDIGNEPDDTQSLVRLLLYSNNIDIEGLIATTSIHLRDTIALWRIKEIISAYGKVYENLLLHEPGFPSSSHLDSVTKMGVPKYGMDGVGEGMDSEGSDWLIQRVDKKDKRPIWVSVWGGSNVLAQALWKVKKTRSEKELNKFLKKLRVYAISDQDNSSPWIRKEFPNLFYIVSPGANYLNATWSGISGEPWFGFASGADTTIVMNNWLTKNIIKNHGPLGEKYPKVKFIMEGDTPSYLSLINNGLNVPERPDYGGWGGRYEYYIPRFLQYMQNDRSEPETRPIWTDARDAVRGKDGKIYIDNHATIWRWRDAVQNDFAARTDWCIYPVEKANHPPIPVLDKQGEITAKVGEWITLDASKSYDPDGDALSYNWIYYPEAGNCWPKEKPSMEGSNSSKLSFKINERLELSKNKKIHIILEVKDNGEPNLSRYSRVIVTILSSKE